MIAIASKDRPARVARIVVPFVAGRLTDEVRALGDQVGAEFCDLTGDDDGYRALLARLWADPSSDLVIVEQDVLPTAAQLDELRGCAEDYCTSAYPYAIEFDVGLHVYEASIFGLGCARFSAALLAREADLFSAGRLAGPVIWMAIDGAIGDALSDRGYRPHRHPAVRHLRAEAMIFQASKDPRAAPGPGQLL